MSCFAMAWLIFGDSPVIKSRHEKLKTDTTIQYTMDLYVIILSKNVFYFKIDIVKNWKINYHF